MNKIWFDSFLDKLPVPTFWAILSIRLVNSLTINTFFQADEYWQALEPAHKAVFGYGYLTWEWELGLRSYLHPLLYMLPYWITKQLHLDYNAVLNAPRLLNALIAAIGEYYLYHLILIKSKNPGLSKLVSYLSIFSAWNWYCWCRSFANSLELSLTIVSLYYLEMKLMLRCLILAALTCLIRPTNAIVWLYYLPTEFIKHPKYILLSVIVALASITFDCEIKITDILHTLGEKNEDPISVGFLTPCHSTPFQSHIHIPSEQANIWFLTCDPPLTSNLKPGFTVEEYLDESDYFYGDPVEFLKVNLPTIIDPKSPIDFESYWPHQWPNYIVIFEDLWQDESIKNILQSSYIIVEQLWNAPFHWDSRRRGDLILLKYKGD
ncbi:hypothetical protein CANINC_000369 [Pichia inconspicua]|uniref:Mannosyltransferase n=1 Tax=Pichia inconspicua TaxID=52247 RepID=A0A4T0X696_9ASCO|nr:hypothetical protein CANINC_000369 [[Candida] inconspicua]